jgi:hypothetical protein
MTQAYDPETDAIELLQRDHDEIRRLLSELQDGPAGTIPAGASKHEAVEEQQERAELGAQLTQGRRLAPTRPHPHMPPDPEIQRLAGRIAGATDRIRDALTGRSGI